MADEGFLIQDELAGVGATLTIPTFLNRKNSSLERKQKKTKRLLALEFTLRDVWNE